ncbi:MAG: hypothetical protein OXB84_05325 [Halobacteriovoraceae bacterium]|nr:hypothetical protein [Halobacteriovoraceae bacterium]
MNRNIPLTRKLQYEFKLRNKEYRIAFWVRAFFILLISIYILDMRSLFPKFDYNKLGETTLLWGLLAGGIFFINFGLFFITTKAAKKFRISATMVYLPCIFLTPTVLTSWSTRYIGTLNLGMLNINIPLYYLSIFMFFLFFLAIYIYFYPWRDSNIKTQWSYNILIKNLKCEFETNRLDFLFRLLIRLSSLVFVGIYIRMCYQYIFEWYRYTLEYFIHSFVYYLIFSIACNFGLFFITTKAAKRNKVCATLTYLPSVLITPIFLGGFTGRWDWVIFLSGLLLIYYHFYPWRK